MLTLRRPSLPTGGATWRRRLGRAAVVVDQGLSSVSNVLAVVLVARVLSPGEFGQFALGYAILTLTLGLSRAYFGSRIARAPDPQSARRLTAALVGGMLVVSPLAALLVLALATLATGGQAPLIAFVVALATPLVCMQDVVRFGSVSSGRPSTALASDGVWILVMAVPFLPGVGLEPPAVLAVWAFGAAAALGVALVAFGERPRLRAGLRELRRHEDVGLSLLLGAVALTTASLVVLLVASRVLGPAAAGTLRGASTAMGPVNVLLASVALGVTPLLVRRARSEDRRSCLTIAGVVAALVLAWGLVLLLVPSNVGSALFGSSWTGIRSVLAFTVAEYVFVAVGTAAVLGLTVRQRGTDLVRTRTLTAVVTASVGTAAALVLHDVTAVAAALALGAFFGAATGWTFLLRHDSRTRSADSGAELPVVTRADGVRCA
jgi:O-antigen/teichoic acid export membrane protein